MLDKLALLVLSCAACQAFILGGNHSNWDGLKVTWSPNPLTAFQGMPRTKAEATGHGWVKMDTGTACQNGPFLGERFWKGGDLGVILLYDVHGYIAGIQAGIEKNYSPNPNHYPFAPLVSHPMVANGARFYITAYFVPTDKICSTGRSETEFRTQGTGTGLWIQNGTNPLTDSEAIPLTIEAARASRWTEGKCFASMGVHFWFNLHKDMSCDHFFPMFLLYNGGVLNGFGWAFTMNIQSSKRLEHPGQSVYAVIAESSRLPYVLTCNDCEISSKEVNINTIVRYVDHTYCALVLVYSPFYWPKSRYLFAAVASVYICGRD